MLIQEQINDINKNIPNEERLKAEESKLMESCESIEEFSDNISYTDYIWAWVDNFYFDLFVVSLTFVLLGVFLSKYSFQVNSEKYTEIKLHYILFLFATSLNTMILIGIFLEKISMHLLKKTFTNENFLFYINETSSHISAIITITLVMIFIARTIGNFEFNILFFTFKIYTILATTVIFVLFYGLQKYVVLNTTYSFNYTTYLARMKRCLFFDLFIKIIEKIHVFTSEENEVMGNLDSNKILAKGLGVNGMGAYTFNTDIFNSKFQYDEKHPMTFGARLVLMKEFDNIPNFSTKSRSNTIISILDEIKIKAGRKAVKITKSLLRDECIEKMWDLERVFRKPKYFNYFLKQMNFKKNDLINLKFIENSLEKAYKEKYLVSNTLKQLHLAIERISKAIKLFIFILYLVCLYISGTGEFTLVGNTFVAALSIPLITSNINDTVIQPIMFLFIVHPYDVGDRVLIKLNGIVENLVVSRLNVFSTQFYRWDGTSLFVTNKILSKNAICNISKSGSITESHSIHIKTDCSPDLLNNLRNRLIDFVKENNQSYNNYISVNYEKIENAFKVYITVFMQYKSNCHDYEKYLQLRSEFLGNLNKNLCELKMLPNDE